MTVTARVLAIVSFGLSAPLAAASEYESEPRLFRIQDQLPVREDTYTLPLTVDLISGVIEGVGIEVELTGSAEIGVLMEGESQLYWPVEGQPRTVRHEVQPLDDSSFVEMVTSMQAEVAVKGKIFGQNFSFTFASLPVDFEDDVSRFTPFLLPKQIDGPTRLNLEPAAGTGAVSLPLSLTGSQGVGGLNLGVSLDVVPQAEAVIEGRALSTAVPQGVFEDTFSTDGSSQTQGGVFPNQVELYDPIPELEMNARWEADIGVEIGYNISLSVTVSGTVLGQNLNASVPVGDFDIPLFPAFSVPVDYEASPDTAPWRHPLPMASVGTGQVVFSEVPGDEVSTQSFPLANQGKLDMEVEVSVEGDETLTANPASLTVPADGASSVVVTYAPDGPGAADAVLVLRTSDPSSPEIRVPITATAIEGAGDDDLTGDGFRDTGSDTFTTCGCASSPQGSHLWVAGALSGLVLVRRRSHRRTARTGQERGEG